MSTRTRRANPDQSDQKIAKRKLLRLVDEALNPEQTREQVIARLKKIREIHALQREVKPKQHGSGKKFRKKYTTNLFGFGALKSSPTGKKGWSRFNKTFKTQEQALRALEKHAKSRGKSLKDYEYHFNPAAGIVWRQR